MKNLFKKLLVTSLLLSTFNVSAAVITYKDSFGTQGSSTDVTLSGFFSHILQIQGFDSNLGTLTNVAITVAAQLNSTGSSQNISTENGRAQIDVTMINPFQVSSSVTDSFVFITADPANPFLTDESAPVNTFNLIPNTANDTFTYDLSTGQINGSLSANSLAAFITSGMLDFNFTAFANTAFKNDVEGGTGYFTNSFTTAAWGQIEVAYTYSTVTEPSSIALFGILLIGLTMRRKLTL